MAPSDRVWRKLLIGTSAGALVLLLSALGGSYVFEAKIREEAHAYLRAEVSRRVEDELRRELPAVHTAAKFFARRVTGASASTEDELTRLVPELVDGWLRGSRVAASKDQSQESGAPEGQTLTSRVTSVLTQSFFDEVKRQAEALRAHALEIYDRKLSALLGDLRLFCGLNAVLFASSLLVLRFRPHATPRLLVPVTLLTLATAVSMGLYLSQDWFWIVLTDAYVGYGYLVIVGVVLALLSYAALGPNPID